jgi:hypothetical protein
MELRRNGQIRWLAEELCVLDSRSVTSPARRCRSYAKGLASAFRIVGRYDGRVGVCEIIASKEFVERVHNGVAQS